jgi:hypothetical protein
MLTAHCSQHAFRPGTQPSAWFGSGDLGSSGTQIASLGEQTAHEQPSLSSDWAALLVFQARGSIGCVGFHPAGILLLVRVKLSKLILDEKTKDMRCWAS